MDDVDDDSGLYCSAEWYNDQVPVADRIAAAIRENPANRQTVPGTDEHRIVDAVLNGTIGPGDAELLPTITLVVADRWAPGTELTIAFLEGSATQQTKVRTWAQEWAFTGLKLTFIDDPNAARIRISFGGDGDRNSYSYLGTTAGTIAAPKKTMNLGWLKDDTADDEYRRVVQHEFGHALGFVHEHQNPAADIQWNRDAVYAYFTGPPNDWTRDKVDSNLFQQYPEAGALHSPFDVASIMIYAIRTGWTTNGFSCPRVNAISPQDKALAATWYPKPDFAHPQAGVVLGADVDGIYLMSLSSTLDRRRRATIGNAWQPAERDFLNLGPVPFQALSLATNTDGAHQLFALRNGEPMQAGQAAGEASWTGFVGAAPPDTEPLSNLKAAGLGSAFTYFADSGGGVLGQGTYENHAWQFNQWFESAPPVTDFALLETRAAFEVFIIPREIPADTYDLQITPSGPTGWETIAAPPNPGVKMLGVPVPSYGDIAMIDGIGGVWACGLQTPVADRHWVSLGSPDSMGSPAVAMSACQNTTTAYLACVLEDGRIEQDNYETFPPHWNGWSNMSIPGAKAVAVHAIYAHGTTVLVAVDSDGNAHSCECPDSGRWGSWVAIP